MNRGEAPGYEFEVPRGQRHGSGPRHVIGHDSLRQFQHAQPEQDPPSSARAAGSGVLDIMRSRNWLMGLAAPILAAIVIGIVVVAILYAKIDPAGGGIVAELSLGALIGLFVVCIFVIHNYVNLNIGLKLTLYQGVTYFIQWLIVGAAIGLIYKPS